MGPTVYFLLVAMMYPVSSHTHQLVWGTKGLRLVYAIYSILDVAELFSNQLLSQGRGVAYERL